MSNELHPPIRQSKPGGGHIFWRCMSYLRPYWPFVLGSYLLLLGNNGISLAIPQIIRSIVDQGIRGGDVPDGWGWCFLITYHDQPYGGRCENRAMV